jgi:flavin reductase (DIM6/NTAB) family NADH-FMN oxidoreductase RutF
MTTENTMTINSNEFKKTLQLWASGVTVVTTQSEKFGLQGMTVSAFSSVSVEPPQILVCLNDAADTRQGIEECQHFAVNILSSAQQEVSNQFAGGTSQEQRFANVQWQSGATGVPVLTDSLAFLECKVVEKLKAGTHWIIIGEVQAAECHEAEPLLYYRGAYRHIDSN